MRAKVTLFLLSLFTPLLAFGQFSDTTPPQLAGFSFSPASIDTTTGPQTVSISWHITDDLAGVATACVSFMSPSRLQSQFVCAQNFVSGTSLDGFYDATLAFPQYTEQGVWKADSVALWDLAGNFVSIPGANLVAAGFPTDLAVTSNPDTAPPTVSHITLTPSTIDATSAATTVTVRLDLQDNVAGVDMYLNGGGTFAFSMLSPSGQQMRVIGNENFSRIAGTDLNGTWEGSFTMPRFSEPGTWNILYVFVFDKAGNYGLYSGPDLQATGLTTTIDVSCATPDLTTPQLLNLSITPAFINVSTSSQFVTFDFNVADDLSGVDWTFDTALAGGGYGATVQSPSGAQQTTTYSPLFQLISGTALSGVWEGSAYFPRYAEAGTWRIASVTIKDTTRNTKVYSTADLVAAGIPTEITVIQPSLTTDGSVGSAGGTITDTTFGSRAQVIVPPGVLSTTTDVAIDVLTSPLAIPNPTGYSAPGTYYVNIELNPTPSYPLPPPGITLVLPLSNALIPGTSIDLFRVDTATGLLVRALDTAGLPVTGTVNADGLSATFAHVAHLSTYAGFVPNKLTIAIDIKPGDGTPTINPTSNGTTPVAILGSASFDPLSMVSRSSLTFGHTGNEASLSHCSPGGQDVNGDGRLDLVCHFFTKKTAFQSGDTKGVLRGKTNGGIVIEGTDAIRVK